MRYFQMMYIGFFVLVIMSGCGRPDLRLLDLEVWKGCDRPESIDTAYDVMYQFIVENHDYGGNIFFRPAASRGEIYVKAYLSSDGVEREGSPAGSYVVVDADESLPVGGQISKTYGATVELEDNLLLNI
jgi:hypothetical protein